MGGCASKPKEFNTRSLDEAPAATTSPKKADSQEEPLDVAQEESKNEESLLDISEPKEEGSEKPAEPKAANVEAVPEEVAKEVTSNAEEEDNPAEAAAETTAEAEAKPVVVEDGAPKEDVNVEVSKTEDSDAATTTTAADVTA